ncbi:MAG: hypothetical protein FWG40_04925 [Peptococcaceae bacterium]|nr:hypothetical protein [Peptococcaceae bacterium]
MRKKIIIVTIILSLIIIAAGGLKLGIAWAAKNEEEKIVSDALAQNPFVLPEGVTVRIDSPEVESLLADISIFSVNDVPELSNSLSLPSQSKPTQYELSEKQAAAIAVNEIQRVFGENLTNTVLVTIYSERGRDYALQGLPESMREKLIEDYKDWIVPSHWSVTAYLVNKEDYADCLTALDFKDRQKYDSEALSLSEGGYASYRLREDYTPIPTTYRCDINGITGEIISIEREAKAELTTTFMERQQVDAQEAEPLYRDYLRQKFPDLTITAVEPVDFGSYVSAGKTIYANIKITMSDGSGWLFEHGDFVAVTYFPKGVPDQEIYR